MVAAQSKLAQSDMVARIQHERFVEVLLGLLFHPRIFVEQSQSYAYLGVLAVEIGGQQQVLFGFTAHSLIANQGAAYFACDVTSFIVVMGLARLGKDRECNAQEVVIVALSGIQIHRFAKQVGRAVKILPIEVSTSAPVMFLSSELRFQNAAPHP